MNRINLPLGDTGRANDRVIRVTNVHFDATPQEISKFFGRFTIIDQIRDTNSRTKTNSVVYVLFATHTQRIQAEWLSGQYIRNRRIKIQPAPTGTYLIKDDHSGFVHNNDTPTSTTTQSTSHIVPQLGETDFPILGSSSRRYSISQLQTDPLQNRILYLNGIHQDAKDDDIRACLNGCPIIDIKRNVHLKSRRSLPTVFILLESAKDRIAVLQQLKGFNMLGRFVTLEVPKKFVNVFELNPMSSPERPIARTTSIDQTTDYHNPRTFTSASNDSSDIVDLFRGLNLNEMQQQPDKHSSPHQPVHSPSTSSENAGVSKKLSGKINSKTVVWGMTPEQLRGLHKSTLEASHTMPSGVDGPNELVIDSRETDPRKDRFDPGVRKVPTGIDTTKAPNDDNWNLSGNKNNMFTPEDWNNFQTDRLRNIYENMEREGTNAGRINRDGGQGEED
ncbi:Nn.00g084290.m01.CDS01 [Neocucurbitaria sp. VM-36]